MSDSVTTSVQVAVSPEAAFDVFTREIDAWYRVDAESLPDVTRTAAIRFEPHVGGRLLDVHDLATGAGRELGRVTVWEPACRLVFADNEGTEVDVGFEPCGTGTRVTLTHRGLERRGSGWAGLAPLYREHVSPHAKPVGLAVASLALVFALVAAVYLTVEPEPNSLSAWVVIGSILVAVLAVSRVENGLARRWLPSRWHYDRVKSGVLALLGLGLLIYAVHGVTQDRNGALASAAIALVVIVNALSGTQQGPARGHSLRKRAGAARSSFFERHPHLWLSALFAAIFVLTLVMSAIDSPLVVPVLMAVSMILLLHHTVARRRRRRALGFDPDLYLVVGRGVGDQDRRPELLIHRPPSRPEYSGWYAYASERDDRSGDLVVWSMQDLVDHAPEAVQPLREGHGEWIWDPARRGYRRAEAAVGVTRTS